MHDGDLNLIHFNKDNYTCYSCHEHQGVGALWCKLIPLMFSTLTQRFVEKNINVGFNIGRRSARAVLEMHSAVSIIQHHIATMTKRTQGSLMA